MRMLYVCVIIHIWLSIEKGLKCHWERHPLLVLSRASNEIVSSGKYLWKINKKSCLVLVVCAAKTHVPSPWVIQGVLHE